MAAGGSRGGSRDTGPPLEADAWACALRLWEAGVCVHERSDAPGGRAAMQRCVTGGYSDALPPPQRREFVLVRREVGDGQAPLVDRMYASMERDQSFRLALVTSSAEF
mmetsp:Transcript_26801/g.86200  ORF Transcript_26801/g.86200 Transcript_26801/m.86200 type:complete len:108 (-) Transcript_26801:34-357(-)